MNLVVRIWLASRRTAWKHLCTGISFCRLQQCDLKDMDECFFKILSKLGYIFQKKVTSFRCFFHVYPICSVWCKKEGRRKKIQFNLIFTRVMFLVRVTRILKDFITLSVVSEHRYIEFIKLMFETRTGTSEALTVSLTPLGFH